MVEIAMADFKRQSRIEDELDTVILKMRISVNTR